MSTRWGRDESYRWPSDKPVWTLTALVVALFAMAGGAAYQFEQWTLLERLYLGTYIGSEMRPWVKSAPYAVLYRIEGKQKRAAREVDLSDPAVSFGKETQGKAKLEWERGVYKNRELKEWLEAAVYGGESPWICSNTNLTKASRLRKLSRAFL